MEYLYLLVGILLVAGIGGMASVVPRKQDRWLAKVRTSARQHGLVVDSVNVPLVGLPAEDRVSSGGKTRKLTRLCVRYQKFYPRSSAKVPQWKLLRDADSTIPLDGWRVDGSKSVGVNLFESEYWRGIEEIVSLSPERCWGVQALPRACAWIGVEKFEERLPDEKVLEIDRFLDLLLDNHLRWESETAENQRTVD